LRPDILFLAQSDRHELTDWIEIAAFARHHGVRSVVLIGPAPQWRPSLPLVVTKHYWGKDFSIVSEGLDLTVLATDRVLRDRYNTSRDLRYVSIIEQLCTQTGCQATIPGKRTDSLIAFDYGHFVPEASAYVAQHLIAKHLFSFDGRAKAAAEQPDPG